MTVPRPLLLNTPVPREIARRLRQEGCNPAPILQGLGFPADVESSPSCVVAAQTVMDLYEQAATLAGDPDFGLHLAAHCNRSAFGLVAFSMRAAATVGEALRRFARDVAHINELKSATVTEDARSVRFELRVPGINIGMGRHANEFCTALVLLELRAATRIALVPNEVFFAHSRPANVQEHVRMFQTRTLRFGRGCSGFVLPRAYLEVPLRTADAALVETVDLHLQSSRQHRVLPTISAAVQRLLRESMGHELPTLEVLAMRLGMRPRTLQRRLAQEHTSVQHELDLVRRELAGVYLREDVSPSEVASLLGYADMPAFRRAFKRWTGSSIDAWKHQETPLCARASASGSPLPEPSAATDPDRSA